MCVSCGFIIQAGESHTEAAELPFNGTIFSKIERNEIRQHTHAFKWYKTFKTRNNATYSLQRPQDNYLASFAVSKLTSELCTLIQWTPKPQKYKRINLIKASGRLQQDYFPAFSRLTKICMLKKITLRELHECRM